MEDEKIKVDIHPLKDDHVARLSNYLRRERNIPCRLIKQFENDLKRSSDSSLITKETPGGITEIHLEATFGDYRDGRCSFLQWLPRDLPHLIEIFPEYRRELVKTFF